MKKIICPLLLAILSLLVAINSFASQPICVDSNSFDPPPSKCVCNVGGRYRECAIQFDIAAIYTNPLTGELTQSLIQSQEIIGCDDYKTNFRNKDKHCKNLIELLQDAKLCSK